MPRHCGPCSSERRNELDHRLLEMDISKESYRSISQDFRYSTDALRRHREKHLSEDVEDIRTAMQEAREKALEDAKQKELEVIQDQAAECMAARLEAAETFFDQLKLVRSRAANLLDLAESSDDLKACASFLRELREQIRLWAELEGKINSAPQIVLVNSAEWIALRNKIVAALQPYPEAREAVVNVIHRR